MDDDFPLVDRARQGDAAAFDELVTLHRGRLVRMLYQMVRNPDDAVDLAQETFVRAWRGVRGFDGRHAFTTWLHRIATNAAIDFMRRQSRRPLPVELQEDALPAPRAPQPMDEAHIHRRIESVLFSLPPEQRAVLVLREMEEYSYEEIARLVGCSQGTVMSRLFHARRKMQAELKDLHETL